MVAPLTVGSRRRVLRAASWCAVHLGAWATGWPRPAAAQKKAKPDRPLSKALVTAVRSREKARQIEASLTTAIEILTAMDDAAASAKAAKANGGQAAADSPARTVTSAEKRQLARSLGEARSGVKEIINSFHLDDNVKAAVLYLDSVADAEAAARRGKSAVELLSLVVEYDALDDMTFDYQGRLSEEISATKLAFSRQAVVRGIEELQKFIDCFDPEDADNAEEVYRAYMGG